MSCRQKIVDHGYTSILKEVRKAPNVYTKVGFPEGGTLGDPKNIPDMTEMIQVAAVHEFGAPKKKIPERSFIRSTFDEYTEDINTFKKQMYQKVLQGKMSAIRAIGLVGEFVLNKTKAKIREGLEPSLKYREGTPLYDTGQLINSLQHVETESK
jgi:phage gpG-like protein